MLTRLSNKIKKKLTRLIISDNETISQIAASANAAKNGRYYPVDDKTILTSLYTGQIIAVDRHDISLTPHLVLKGEWEMELTRLCEAIVQPIRSPVILDVGANVGWYGLVLSRFCPGATVHFFEANPNLVKLLSKSVLVNGLAMRSTINHYAVSSAPGKSLTLEIPELHKGSASTCGFNVDLSLFHESSDNIERLTVQSISIDSFCTQNSIQSVTFIKIDVEGGEEQVLLGCEQTIRSSQSLVVMMEWNKNRYSDNLRKILRLFTWCGGIDQARSWNDLSAELQEAKTIKHFEEMVSARIGKESGHFDLFFGMEEADMSLAASVSTG